MQMMAELGVVVHLELSIHFILSICKPFQAPDIDIFLFINRKVIDHLS